MPGRKKKVVKSKVVTLSGLFFWHVENNFFKIADVGANISFKKIFGDPKSGSISSMNQNGWVITFIVEIMLVSGLESGLEIITQEKN